GTAMPDPLPAGVYAAVDGVFAGAIRFSDSVKPEAKGAIEELRRLGVSRTVILSGDSRDKAEAVGSELSVDRVESGLLPKEKHRTLELIMDGSAAGTVYVGDGINDAPSLVRADAGVAMGGIGSDSAIESADLVIVSDSLAKLPEAVRIARKTLRIARENIVLALAVKGAVLVLGALGFAGMWAAVFADVGVAVICVLNSMRTLLK
ncbi:MAG: HAD-IC family P-type ATPase, partial [Clostridia bacterium]|nr:HAD-IC family P-type ATPase [Clostridia bacterium]